MIERLAIFGATGDLTARYLLPGLAALQAAGQLSGRFRLVGAGREEWDTEDFRQWAAAQLDRHGGQYPAAARQAVVSASSYHKADVADVPSVADAIAGDGPVAAYLALPPAVFPIAASSLHDAGLHDAGLHDAGLNDKEAHDEEVLVQPVSPDPRAAGRVEAGAIAVARAHGWQLDEAPQDQQATEPQATEPQHAGDAVVLRFRPGTP